MNRIQYPQFSTSAEVTNETGVVDVKAAVGTDTYIKIERILLSIFRAATGGGGTVQLISTLGTVIYTTNADGVKDVSFDFGPEGYQVPVGLGLQLLSANAGGEQASASLLIKGHTTPRGE